MTKTSEPPIKPNTMMKVLMLSRATLFENIGGDTIQIKKTAEYLEKLFDICVDIKLSNQNFDVSQYDLIHFFNIIRPSDLLSFTKKNKPFVISPVFVDFSEMEKNHTSKLRRVLSFLLDSNKIEYLKCIARWLKNGEKIADLRYLYWGHKKSVLYLIKNTKLLLPNSFSEYKRLTKKFNIEHVYRVIPNAIDINVFSESNIDTKYKKYQDYIVCIGQITPKKNQLKLIRAINDSNYNLLIIGKPAPNTKHYYDKCRTEAKENISFLDFMSQEKLVSILYYAKVHALPSWFETTGLVSLEAIMMGCNIVITDKGDQKEYYENYGFYCDPSSVESIYAAVVQAFNTSFQTGLKEKTIEQYTWEATAQKTYKGYQLALSNQ